MQQGFISWVEQVIRSLQVGKPTVIDDPKEYRLIKNIKAYTGLYDGTDHGVVVHTGENCVTEYSINGENWELHSPVYCDAGIYTVYIRVTRKKRIEHAVATVSIQKRTIIIHSASASKQYDGSPINKNDVTILGDGLAKKEHIKAQATGSQLLVGKCINTVEYEFLNKEIQQNYIVKKEEGTLRVTDRNEKYNVVIKGKDAEYLYYGTDFEVRGLETDSFFIGDIKYYISGIDSFASLKHAGTVQTSMTGTCTISDQFGNNVSDQFEVLLVPGTLQVRPRRVKITSSSGVREYNGSDLVNSKVKISGDGFVQGEEPRITVTGTQHYVGVSDNTFLYELPKNANIEDYVITTEYGTLEVTNRRYKYHVTIKGNDAEYIYNGLVSVVQGFEKEKVNCGGNEYRIDGISSYASLKHVGVVQTRIAGICRIIDRYGNNVRDQFDVKIIPGTLRIYPRNVKITSASVVREYNGSGLVNSEVKISGDSFVQGEEPNITVTGKQDYIGTSANTFSYELPKNVNRDDYVITTEFGTLEICNRKVKYTIDVYLNGGNYLYDGQKHWATGIRYNNVEVDGNTYYIDITDKAIQATHAGVYSHDEVESLRIYDEGEDVTEQFNINIHPGSLVIRKRVLILESDSAVKEYDGTPLETDHYTISGYGLANGESIIVSITGRQTLVGKSQNSMSYVFSNGVMPGDYSITKKEGSLEVINRKEKYQVILEANSGEYKYDGRCHTVEGFKNNTVTANNQVFVVTGIRASGVRINAGENETFITGSAIVRDMHGNDVSKQFEVQTIPGILRIQPRNVLITSASDSKEYNGSELIKNEILITGDGFISGEEPVIEVTGRQKHVGSSENTFSYGLPRTVNKDNYCISTEFGTLEVYGRKEKYKVDIYLKGGNFVYDGNEHCISGVMDNRVQIGDNIYTIEITDRPILATHAGVYRHCNATVRAVYDDERFDVSDQFEVNTRPALVRISKRSIILASDSASKEFDGTPLEQETYSILGDGLAEGDELIVSVTGSQYLVGKSRNKISYAFPQTVLPEDYSITTAEGTLEVTNRVTKFPITLVSNYGDFKYDGIEHVVEGFLSDTVTVNEQKYVVSGIKAYASQLHAGNSITTTTGEPVVKDMFGNDVSNQFEISSVPGTLSIHPRNVIIKSASESREYNGSVLINRNVEFAGDCFLRGDEPSVVMTGKQMLVGRSDNRFIFELPANVNRNDYFITTEFGTLEVLPRSEKYNVEVHLCGGEYQYDGKEHVVTGAEEKDLVIEGNRFWVSIDDEPVAATEPGKYQHDKTNSVRIYDTDDNDVTDQFYIRVIPGTIIINSDKEPDKDNENEIDDYDILIHQILMKINKNNASEKVKKYTRKELEALYEDKKELIISDGKVSPSFSAILDKWEEKSNIAILHNRIVEQIQGVKLLSEIEIDNNEYKLLIEYAKRKCALTYYKTGIVSPDILFSMAMVQIGVRKYSNNYWPQVEAELKIAVGQVERKWIGSIIAKTLSVLGKPVYSETEYVTNILMHCIVTDLYANRFFEYLFSYYRIDLERDISGLHTVDLDYICDSIINPYSKRKQLLSDYLSMSIRADKDYCRSMIKKSLNMIDHTFWDEDIPENESLMGRMLEHFNKWAAESDYYNHEKQKNKKKIQGGGRVRLYRSPHLIFDPGYRDFIVVLPQQMIPVNDEAILPEVTWVVLLNKELQYECKLEEGYSGYKTKEIRFSIKPEEIFNKALFFLFANNTLLRSFSWDNHKSAFFNKHWDWVKGVDLEPGKNYAFCQTDVSIESDALLFEGRLKNLNYYEFDFEEGDIVSVKGEDNFYIGSVPSAGLREEGRISGVFANYGDSTNLPIYKNAPQLIIEIEEGQLNGTAIFSNGVVNRLADMNFIDVQVGNSMNKKYYFISAAELNGSCEGYNRIVVDYPNSLKELHAEYYLAPEFTFEFTGAPYIFKEEGQLVFCGHDIYELDFAMQDLNDGVLEIEYEDVIFGFKVPLMLTSWDRENWSYKPISDIWHVDLQNMLYIRFPSDEIDLYVYGVNADDSRVTYRVLSDGIFNCDLTKLKSYFSTKTMMNSICFEADNNAIKLFKIINKSILLKALLKANPSENQIEATIKILGKNEYYAELYCEDVLISEKEPIEEGKITFYDIDVETADYTVKIYESEDEFGFDDEYEYVGKKTCHIVNIADLMGGRMKVKYIQYGDQKLTFPDEYDYYIFPEKQIEEGAYNAIVSGVFHKKSVMYASRVIIKFKNADDPTQIVAVKENIKNNTDQLGFDVEKESVIDYMTKHRNKNRYIYLDQTQSIWHVEFMGFNKRLYELSRVKMLETEKLRNRAFTIWKN